MTLRACTCDNCKAWTSQARPTPLSVQRADELRRTYEATRSAWLTNNPPLSRDQLERVP